MSTEDTSPTAARESSSDDFQTFLTEYLARIERDGTVAIDEFRARHPEFASQLGHQLEWLANHLWRKKEAMPERIGAFRVMQRLGTGGMGEVFLAEQSTPFKRVVAVKVIRLGKNDEARVLRFANEAQLLASLNHDRIARVYDAGVDRGMPWFSMEYVPGKSLTAYCAEERLDVDARLRLFLEICKAVEYAHQQGILHRDLKPSNILVYGPRSQPVVKVIDFGLAKLIEPDAALARITQTAQVVGTPDYMSPEQVDAASLTTVDTRTDVYALGVVLYELLTGALPLHLAKMGVKDLKEMVRTIREREPSSPSIRVEEPDSSSETSPTTCTGISAHALSRQLAGDLDSIVMKALAKDVDRRYGTVHQLAEDIERYLRHEPVSTRRSTWSYVLHKFLRRHRVGASFAAALTAVTIAGVAGIVLLALSRARQLERGELFGMARFLEDLRAQETMPPPARPENLDELRGTLTAFEDMSAQQDRIHAFLDGPVDAEGVGKGWSGTKALEEPQRAALSKALETLRLMGRPGAELDELRLRIDWARRVQANTIEAHRQAWEQARKEIGSAAPYGFDMPPQIGLVPLGRDPDTNLQEFALLLPNGELPRRVDGKLTMGARTCPIFVLLPGGEVTVGAQNENPDAPRYDESLSPTEDHVRSVTLQPFFASKFEFTNGQWALVLGGEHRDEPPEVYDDPLRPVVNLEYASMLHVLLAWGMCLPTSDEWEYLARGGSEFPYASGPRGADLQYFANLLDRTARRAEPNIGEGNEEPWEDGFVMTAPVGSLRPNGYGLYDVHGNALEPAVRIEEDGVTQLELRGGSWNQAAQRARILFRPKWGENGLPSIGFRPVITVRR